MEETTKIALVDDHKLFRDGLKRLLEMSGVCRVVAEASNGVEFTGMLAEGGLVPDVVLLDIDMPHMDGFEVAEKVAAQCPGVKIIVLSMHGDEEYYFRMVSLGVKGFLLKNSEIDEVLTAIDIVKKGGTYFSQELLTSLVGTLHTPALEQPGEPLSERELEILRLVCKGLSNQEIGEQLFISKRTVDKHRANILAKTGAKNTANLVIYAIRHSLIDTE